jgi:ABC-2 type transport system permease protein
MPLIVVGIAAAATAIMLTLQSLIWGLGGFSPGVLRARIDLPFMWLSLLYGLPFMVLWNAPLFAWALLVSAWSRRMPILWAAAPFVAVLLVEHTVLHHTPAHWIVERRVGGGILQPYSLDGTGAQWVQRLSDLDPVRLYTLPGLWIGVMLAAILLAAAIRVRRSRTPN